MAAKSNISAAEVRLEIERVLASRTFRRAMRHRAFIAFLVEETLAGRHSRLKEITIGIEVFGRKARSFDPQQDTVVRVEARRLRARLARYYATEGSEAEVVISLPKGAYVPGFARRSHEASQGLEARSIGLLPFANLTADPVHDALCAGLNYEVADALVRLRDLKVVSRVSPGRVKQGEDSSRAIGEALGVEALLEGGVQLLGDRVRLVAQLVQAADGRCLWSGSFESAIERRHILAHRMANAVVLSIQAGTEMGNRGPSRSPSVRPISGGTASAEARDFHDRGRYLIRQRSLDAYRSAADLFRAATIIDPDFALAHASLAWALTNVVAFSGSPPRVAMPEARRAVRRALELAADLGTAHAVHAAIQSRFEYDWTAATRSYRTALELSPGEPSVHSSYGWALAFQGLIDEAEARFAHAIDLDPLDTALRAHLACLDLYRGDYDRAAARLARLLDAEPSHLFSIVVLGVVQLCAGRVDKARASFERAIGIAPSVATGHLGMAQVLAATGERAAARAKLEWARASFGAAYVSSYQCAMVYARMKDADAAFAWLREAEDQRDFNLTCLAVDPTFMSLRTDPRWRPTLVRLGLADGTTLAGAQALADGKAAHP